MSLTDLTIAGMKAGMGSRDFSAAELTEAHLTAMAAARGLNAFIVETPEIARTQAAAADAALAKGDAKPLTGIPLGIKDLFCTKGVQTTAGSKILQGFIPQYESTVSGKLLADGAVMLGKLNMDEFAMGTSNDTSAYGSVNSPWKAVGSNRELVPGGPSGGSAAAVAARIVAGATGTDTGGSIRQPASFVGISGIKPTYGRCSRWGVVAFASSLDQAGPMARTVEDCALLLTSMCGYDAKDSTSLNIEVPDFAAGLTGD
ncbi:MAG: Asp-tRNA(Asn)/Glu-tRNA(Gln) amidotransferase subunit GatA, partial [Sandarakinorhabdus sp.]|nr:Asp-tRNA(Asn)/Glu-tRNA(Gln) amidotransferase subunit GatA [Sandarakinorhabdus sp.]